MAPVQGGGGGVSSQEEKDKYKDAEDAKHLLDIIGKDVYETVKNEAQTYKQALTGQLSFATLLGVESAGITDTCKLVGDYYNKRVNADNRGERYPCKNLKGITKEERFSNTLGGQCTDKKREDLEKKLKEIFGKIHEGLTNGVKERYQKDGDNYYQLREYWWYANRATIWEALTCDPRHKAEYFRPTCDSGDEQNKSTLAKDKCRCQKKNGEHDTDQVPTYFDYVPQYLRWFEEWAEDFCRLRKRKLENAKEQCRGKNGEDKYCDLNRYDCTQTASGKHDFFEGDDCIGCHFSCAHFVKWIDNQKLEFLKQREKYTKEMQKYTNGESRGTGVSKRKKPAAGKSNYDGYEKKFYEQLKEKDNYETVGEFLGLLNNEKTCTKNTEIKEGGTIHFENVNSRGDDGNNETFSHTTYCQACPWCGAERKSDGGWKAKDDGDCNLVMDYTKYENTEIPILTGDKTKSEIVERYTKFCKNNGGNGAPGTAKDGVGSVRGTASNSDNATTGYCGTNNSDKGPSLCEKWTCYYKKKNENDVRKKDINFCVQGEWKEFKKGQKVKPYNVFFWDWVYHMLHDSVEWRNELGSCINNAKSGQCKNSCKRPCECFAKWVQQKEKEWQLILQHFKKQGGFDKRKHEGLGLTQEIVLELLLEKNLLLKSIKDTHANADDIDRIEKMLKEDAAKHGGAPGTKKKSIIVELLQHEENDANKCKNCQPTKVKNPCYGEKSDKKKYDVLAEKVAKEMQQQTREEMLRRSADKSVKGDKSSLEGDISLAEFKNGGQGSDLIGDNICNISIKHSNDSRGTAGGPCKGKDNDNNGVRMKIGTTWKPWSQIQMSAQDIYMPPRREHMCTSNLEHLNTGNKGLSNSSIASNSLLGDVLLAAKEEAEDIKNKAKGKDAKNGLTKDQATTCRAIRRSFADLGDIIRGRDLWDRDEGEQITQNNLVTIFGKINEKLPKEIRDKYKNPDGKHLELRKDWWEANRETVWDAMTCPTKNGNIQCGATPYDDYIPQRLRWMVEWAEWYCKMQSQLYGQLLQKCGNCKNKIKGQGQSCTSGDSDCTKCTKACEEYKKEIDKWKKQWEQMQIPYVILYYEAQRNSDGMVLVGTYPDYKQVVHFFKKLKETIKSSALNRPKRSTDAITTDPTTPYSSAAGYIHQEARTGLCLEQNEFCEKENGDNSTSGGKENEKYAFKKPPPDYVEACECESRPQQPAGGRARSEDGPQSPAAPGPSPGPGSAGEVEEDEGSEEEEEEEEENEDEEKKAEPVKDNTVEDKVGETATDTSVNVCETVEEALDDMGSLKQACEQKYSGNNSRLGWKCIPTGNTSNEGAATGGPTAPGVKSGSDSSSSGSICIPPRRRKLYVGKLEQWANETLSSGESSPGGEKSPVSGETPPAPTQASTSSRAQNPLLAAFVESAAIETFFLWHKYKMEKKREDIERKEREKGLVVDKSSKPDELDGHLKEGKIDDEFKRQMFYTLGDYRDILFSGDKDEKNGYIDILRGDKEMEQREEKIKGAIQTFFQNGDSQTPSGKPVPQNSDEKRTNWWKDNAKYIWEGMICALTYEHNGAKGTSNALQQNEEVRKAFFGDNNKLTPGPPLTNTGTFESKYNYNTVTFEGGFNGGTTKLEEFVKRPPYFRWLEEWGEEFCRKQKHKLYIIEKDCRGKNGGKVCSGDGFECNEMCPCKDGSFETLKCPSCANSCRSYRKWINKKKEEFDKQDKIYKNEIEHAKLNYHDNGFCKTLKEKYSTLTEFLSSLKGPCCKTNTVDTSINFKNTKETFKHATNCNPCSEFKVNCQNDNCTAGTQNECNGKTAITAKKIEQMRKSTDDVNMLVSDNGATEFDDLSECKDKGIFKGIRKDVWKCGEVCGVHICNLKKKDNIREEGDKKYITMKELLKRWLEYFLEDYNKINKKLKPCINNSDGSKCIKDYDKKFKCIDEWIKLKQQEWEKIKKDYLDKYKSEDSDTSNMVKSFLGQKPFYNEILKAIKPCPNLEAFEKSCGLYGTDNSQNGNNNDLVLCLLTKLKTKIDECKTQHTGDTERTCKEESPSVEDDDEEPYEDLLLQETEEKPDEAKKKMMPKICKDVLPEPQPEPDDKCGKQDEEEKEEEKDKGDQAEEEVSVPKKPEASPPKQPKPPKRSLHPTDDPWEPLKNAMLSSTIMWSIGIGFAAFTYFYLK
ncbi:hypothetical protein PFTANZ_06514, partial [Plasmodium falciparum Tanzania (2000708)]